MEEQLASTNLFVKYKRVPYEENLLLDENGKGYYMSENMLPPCFHFFVYENGTFMQIAQKSVSKSIQNECAADTAGGVQRGLGMLPQQAICENFSSGGIFVNK